MRTHAPVDATRCSRDLPGEADRSRQEAVQRVHRLACLGDGDAASEDLLPRVRLFDNPIADLLQGRRVGMPDAGVGHRLAGGQVEIVAGRHLLRPRCLRVPEVDSDLHLVRTLVRREPDVAVDAGQRSAERLGVRNDVGADLLQPLAGVANEPQARFLDGLLVAFLVLREPFLVVVLRQLAEERKEFRREVFQSLGHRFGPRSTGIASHRLNIGANGRASKTARTEAILSPRTRYHSQMNAVPAAVFVTMSYSKQTSSPSTNVFRGSTRAIMWWSLPNASRYGSGRLNDSNGPTNDRSSCMYRRALAKSPFPNAL